MTIEGIEHHIKLCCELQEKEGWMLINDIKISTTLLYVVPLHTPYTRKEGRKEGRSKQVLLDTPFSF